MSDFIDHLKHNQALLHEMIDRGLKTHNFDTDYAKKVGSLCVDVLTGDLGAVAELFIREEAPKAVDEHEMSVEAT